MVFFSRREAEVLFDEHIRSTIKTSLVDLEDGSFGWYRDLSRNDTVGIVATAQMLSIISFSYDFDVEVINKPESVSLAA
ncbi:hypothetical protein [Vreelandella salicampi]|uniref:Uncharacterized protein n=1 Tax=Vreelandella salicampi TaxID=1449798 RepID=A0A7Z0LM93_9GAMM|nr:hypothetical protein [Halomonas salicampi]NYS61548.1 hypothetical protein [Halomonas salicampi]